MSELTSQTLTYYARESKVIQEITGEKKVGTEVIEETSTVFLDFSQFEGFCFVFILQCS